MDWNDARSDDGNGPIDPPDQRPGARMEAEPHPAAGAHWGVPEPQPGIDERIARSGFPRKSVVAGPAYDSHVVSAALRRKAYAIPEHRTRHWLMLMLADRVDVAEDRLGSALSRPFEAVGLAGGARRARENPLLMLAGAALSLLVVRRLLR